MCRERKREGERGRGLTIPLTRVHNVSKFGWELTANSFWLQDCSLAKRHVGTCKRKRMRIRESSSLFVCDDVNVNGNWENLRYNCLVQVCEWELGDTVALTDNPNQILCFVPVLVFVCEFEKLFMGWVEPPIWLNFSISFGVGVGNQYVRKSFQI